jgi:Mn-dependent DtxR family transcriptional regulator
MNQPLTRAEWTVLDNAARARPHSHGFNIAPANLNAVVMKLTRLGLIEKSYEDRYLLTLKGRTAHSHAARRYETLK